MRALAAFEIAILKTHRTAWRYPRSIFFIFLLLSTLAFFGLKRTHFIISVEDMKHEGLPAAELYANTRFLFDDGFSSTLLLSLPDSNFSPDQVCKLWTWFAGERNRHPTLKKSFSTFDLMYPKSTSDFYLEFKDLFPLNCNPTKNTQKELDFSFVQLKNFALPALRNSEGAPTLLFQLTFEEALNSRLGSFDPKVVSSFRLRAEETLPTLVPNLRMQWIGDADYQFYVGQGLERAKILNLTMVLVLTFLIVLVLRRLRPALIFTSTLILSGVWIYGAKGWMNSPFDILSNSLFLILGVSTLEDFFFICQEQAQGRSLRAAFRRVLVPCFYTSLTTALGFLSLCASDLKMIQRLGMWAGVGAIVEWAMIFLLIPSLLQLFKSRKKWVESLSHLKFLDRTTRYTPHRLITRLALLGFPLAVASVFFLKVQDSPEVIFPKNHSYRKDLDLLSSQKNWKGNSYLVFPPETSHDDRKWIENELKSDSWKPLISAVESSEALLQFFTENLRPAHAEVVRREFRYSDAYKSYFSSDLEGKGSFERLILYLPQMDLDFVNDLNSKLEVLCAAPLPNTKARCYSSGRPMAFADFASRITKTLYESIFWGLFDVSLLLIILAWHKNQLKNIFGILTSSLWGPAMMLMFTALFQVPINSLTTVFMSVLMGLAGDNAIQFLYGSKRKNLIAGLENKGASALITGSLMALSSLVFLGAYYEPPKVLGLLLFFGIIVSVIGDLWILSSLSHKTHKSR